MPPRDVTPPSLALPKTQISTGMRELRAEADEPSPGERNQPHKMKWPQANGGGHSSGGGAAHKSSRHPRLAENLIEADNVFASLLERLGRIPEAETGLHSGPMPHRLRRPRPKVEAIIDRSIEEGERLLSSAESVVDRSTYEEWVHDTERWHARTRDALASSYEGDEAPTEFYESATGGIVRVWGGTALDEEFDSRQTATRAALNTLRSFRERLEYAELITPTEAPPTAPAAAAVGSEVFLVHGRDEARKQTVARFLEQVTGQGVTILEEQPDRGRTIIEKFEDHADDVGYAVVLLTGDDEGRQRGEEELNPRARQNVILELGFFIGRLGRGNVALLYEERVDLPGDIDGVLYQALDDGGAWKLKLARELRAAGIPIDADAILGV